MTSVNITSVENTVVVTENSKTTVVAVPQSTAISTIVVGVQGPQGPVGVFAYVHTQSAPSATWTVNHNLGYRPAVEILDSGSQEIDGEVSHPTINQTVITLNPASAGIARLI